MNRDSGSKYQFKLVGIEPAPELEEEANLKLVQLLALAPPGARAVGLVEKIGSSYVSAIEVSSPYRAFFEKATGSTPELAIHRALDKLEDRLYRWRFGGNSNGTPTHPGELQAA